MGRILQDYSIKFFTRCLTAYTFQSVSVDDLDNMNFRLSGILLLENSLRIAQCLMHSIPLIYISGLNEWAYGLIASDLNVTQHAII